MRENHKIFQKDFLLEILGLGRTRLGNFGLGQRREQQRTLHCSRKTVEDEAGEEEKKEEEKWTCDEVLPFTLAVLWRQAVVPGGCYSSFSLFLHCFFFQFLFPRFSVSSSVFDGGAAVVSGASGQFFWLQQRGERGSASNRKEGGGCFFIDFGPENLLLDHENKIYLQVMEDGHFISSAAKYQPLDQPEGIPIIGSK